MKEKEMILISRFVLEEFIKRIMGDCLIEFTDNHIEVWKRYFCYLNVPCTEAEE